MAAHHHNHHWLAEQTCMDIPMFYHAAEKAAKGPEMLERMAEQVVQAMPQFTTSREGPCGQRHYHHHHHHVHACHYQHIHHHHQDQQQDRYWGQGIQDHDRLLHRHSHPRCGQNRQGHRRSRPHREIRAALATNVFALTARDHRIYRRQLRGINRLLRRAGDDISLDHQLYHIPPELLAMGEGNAADGLDDDRALPAQLPDDLSDRLPNGLPSQPTTRRGDEGREGASEAEEENEVAAKAEQEEGDWLVDSMDVQVVKAERTEKDEGEDEKSMVPPAGIVKSEEHWGCGCCRRRGAGA